MNFIFILLLTFIFILFESASPACYKRDPFSTLQLCVSNEVSNDFHPDNENFRRISNLPKYYYIESKNSLTWFAALHTCRQIGGDLVNFENEKEFVAVTNELKILKKTHYWIGMTNLGDQKEYTSLGTGLKPSFVKWYDNEPNNKRNNENCAELVTQKKKWFMNDFECNLKNYFICETKLPTQIKIVVW